VTSIKFVLALLCAAGLASSADRAPQPVPRKAPRFELRLLDGKSVSDSSLSAKVAVIDFWGTWCKPCLAEIPEYNEFYRTYKDRGVVFIAVAFDSGSEEDVRAAVKRLKIEYPVAAPSLKELDAFGDILAVPTTWVIDRNGLIVKEFLGASPGKHKALNELVDRLTAK
jgi:thiol-disulfide isomerase/thioredoxin